MCNRLIKIFGRFTVFFSIVAMAGTYEKVDDPFRLLYRICERKFEAAHGEALTQARESLDSYLNSLEKDIAKQRKSKIKAPSPEGLE